MTRRRRRDQGRRSSGRRIPCSPRRSPPPPRARAGPARVPPRTAGAPEARSRGARGRAVEHASLDGAVVKGRDDLFDAQARGVAASLGLRGVATQVLPLRLGDRHVRRRPPTRRTPGEAPGRAPRAARPSPGARAASATQGGGIEPEARDGDEEVGGPVTPRFRFRRTAMTRAPSPRRPRRRPRPLVPSPLPCVVLGHEVEEHAAGSHLVSILRRAQQFGEAGAQVAGVVLRRPPGAGSTGALSATGPRPSCAAAREASLPTRGPVMRMRMSSSGLEARKPDHPVGQIQNRNGSPISSM